MAFGLARSFLTLDAIAFVRASSRRWFIDQAQQLYPLGWWSTRAPSPGRRCGRARSGGGLVSPLCSVPTTRSALKLSQRIKDHPSNPLATSTTRLGSSPPAKVAQTPPRTPRSPLLSRSPLSDDPTSAPPASAHHGQDDHRPQEEECVLFRSLAARRVEGDSPSRRVRAAPVERLLTPSSPPSRAASPKPASSSTSGSKKKKSSSSKPGNKKPTAYRKVRSSSSSFSLQARAAR